MTGKAAVETGRSSDEQMVGQVRERYGRIAETGGGCCGTDPVSSCCGGDSVSVQLGYRSRDLAVVPEGADLGLGCGAPVEALAPRPGETVLDLGSGPGLDAFLASRAVGPQGRVIGVDMTPAMLERARGNARKGGYANVEFREGRLESLPVEDASVDAVTSNCVINLVPDKAQVFREIARVLKPGGRLVVSDIVLDGELPAAIARDVYAYVGCIAGADQRASYFAKLEGAGLGQLEILKDADYLAAVIETVPEAARELLERNGVREEEVLGKVRSLTFRARKSL